MCPVVCAMWHCEYCKNAVIMILIKCMIIGLYDHLEDEVLALNRSSRFCSS